MTAKRKPRKADNARHVENPWPRQHFNNDPKAAADSLTRDSKEFLLAHSKRQHKPSVPDSVWHGNDCWVLEHVGSCDWRIGAFAREVMAVLSEGHA